MYDFSKMTDDEFFDLFKNVYEEKLQRGERIRGEKKDRVKKLLKEALEIIDYYNFDVRVYTDEDGILSHSDFDILD